MAPTTASVTADIVAPNFSKNFGYTGNKETFTVQTSGYYDITAAGAQGGSGNNAGNHGATGGYGAMASGESYLAAGTKLEIVVGGSGGSSNTDGGGGGGGRFVSKPTGPAELSLPK